MGKDSEGSLKVYTPATTTGWKLTDHHKTYIYQFNVISCIIVVYQFL